jgi:hypothetical protein
VTFLSFRTRGDSDDGGDDGAAALGPLWDGLFDPPAGFDCEPFGG